MIPRYTRPEMARIWSDENRFRTWLAVEVAATETLAEAGMVPKDTAKAIRERADFNLGTNGELTVFSRNAVTGITFHKQTRTDPAFIDVPLTANLAALPINGAVGKLAFGRYLSPDYEVHPSSRKICSGLRKF